MATYELQDHVHKSHDPKFPLLDSSLVESIHSASSFEHSSFSAYQDYEYSPYELPITKRFSLNFFRYRNKILRFFSNRMPGLSYEIGPVLAFVLYSFNFFLMEYLIYSGNDSRTNMRKMSGTVASLSLGYSLILACRNSILTIILGIPFERALFWHKFFAYWAVILAILHGIIDDFAYEIQDWSGLGLSTFMILIAIFAFFPIRRRFFRFFQLSHWFFFTFAMICAIIHGAGEALFGLLFFLLDLAIRFYIIRRNKKNMQKICIEKLPFSVLRVSFAKKTLKYKPGQYFFVCFPMISCYEFHPFSISSSPSDDQVLLHIRIIGAWTRNLMDSLKKTVNPEIDAFIDGPYGNPDIFLDSDEIKIFLMVSGGIGITPLQSICRELLNQKNRGRNVKKIMFIWSVRDSGMLNSEEMADFYKRDLPIVFQPDFFAIKEDETLQCRFHLTGARNEGEFYKGNIHPSKQKSLRLGRPNIQEYVKEAVDFALKFNEKKIGVLCCGPEELIRNVREECWKSQGKNVQFMMHEEVFEF